MFIYLLFLIGICQSNCDQNCLICVNTTITIPAPPIPPTTGPATANTNIINYINILAPVCKYCDQKNGFVLQNITCVPSTQDNCSVLSPDGSCLVCNPGFIIDNKNYRCAPIPKAKQILNCQTYNSDLSCQLCNSGFYLLQSGCQYISNPIEGCHIQYNSQYCYQCKQGYILSSDYTQCYQNSGDKCAIYSQMSCSQCSSQYFLNENYYLDLLSLGDPYILKAFNLLQQNNYVSNHGSKIMCELSPIPNCIQFSSHTLCSQCSENFSLSADYKSCINTKLTVNQVLTNCAVLFNSTHCSKCQDTYYLNNGTCSQINPIPNCMNVINQGGNNICNLCSSDYFTNITNCNPRTILSNITNCTRADPMKDACLTCSQGYLYAPLVNLCYKQIQNCSNQTIPTINQISICAQCSPFFMFDIINNNCFLGTIANCYLYDPKYSVCQQCQNKFFFNGTVCSPQPELKSCNLYDPLLLGVCNQCLQGYTFVPQNQICVNQTILPDQNCVQYDNKTTCTKCVQQYQLLKNTTHTFCQANNITNCQVQNGTVCLNCQMDYIPTYNNTNCTYIGDYPQLQNCSPHTNITMQTRECDACNSSSTFYNLSPDFLCVSSNLFSLNNLNQTKDPFCTNYNKTNCVQCDWNAGYILNSTAPIPNCIPISTCPAINRALNNLFSDEQRVFYCNSSTGNAFNTFADSLSTLNLDTTTTAPTITTAQTTANLPSSEPIQYFGTVFCKSSHLTLLDISNEKFYHNVNNVNSTNIIYQSLSPISIFRFVNCSQVTNVTKTVINCAVYAKVDTTGSTCARCNNGYTGKTDSFSNYLDCNTTIVNCTQTIYNGYSLRSNSYLSCHQCSYGVPSVKNDYLNQTIYSQTSQDNITQCLQTNKTGCAVVAYQDSDPLVQYNQCIECSPGYRKTQTAQGIVCSQIDFCSLNSNWPNSCSQCILNYTYPILADKKIDYTTCIKTSDQYCFAFNPTLNQCAICKAGYVLNPYNVCDQIQQSNCQNSVFGFSFHLKLALQQIQASQFIPQPPPLLPTDTPAANTAPTTTIAADTTNTNNIASTPTPPPQPIPFYMDQATYYYLYPNGASCQKCHPGYYGLYHKEVHSCLKSSLNKSQETSNNYIPNCSSYAKSFPPTCSVCLIGYMKTASGSCVPGTNLFKNCAVANQNNSECVQCNPGYLLWNKICIAEKEKDCIGTPYLNTTSYTCIRCPDQYMWNVTTCVLGSVPNCQAYSFKTQNRCNICKPQFFLIQIQNRDYCMPIQPTSEDSCVRYSHDNPPKCLSCYKPSAIVIPQNTTVNVCLPFVRIEYCKIYSQTPIGASLFPCQMCYDGYYLSNSSCIQRAVASLPHNCQSYDPYGQNCGICTAPYKLDSKGNCVTGIPNCELMSSDKTFCKKCFPFYFPSSKGCSPLPTTSYLTNCSYYSSPTDCQQCVSPYYIFQGVCISQMAQNCSTYTDALHCSSCKARYYLNITSINETNCIPYNDINCLQTDFGQINPNNGTFPFYCNVCFQGYYLNINQTCSQVSNLIYSCQIYSDANNCAQCNKGYVLSSSKQNCTLFASFNSTSLTNSTGTKISLRTEIPNADPNCITSLISTTNLCSVCLPGYYLKQGICIQCLNSISQGCFSCDYYNPNLCLMCASGYYMDQFGNCQMKLQSIVGQGTIPPCSLDMNKITDSMAGWLLCQFALYVNIPLNNLPGAINPVTQAQQIIN